MTQLTFEPKPTAPVGIGPRTNGVVFVPCAICRGPVDLAVVTEANDAPLCGKHFVSNLTLFN